VRERPAASASAGFAAAALFASGGHRLDRHGVEENRAYEVAGIGLTDVRAVRANKEMRRALERVRAAGPTVYRLLAIGMLDEVPWPDNDNRGRGRG